MDFAKEVACDSLPLVLGMHRDSIDPGPPFIEPTDDCPDDAAVGLGNTNQIRVFLDFPFQIALIALRRLELPPELEHLRNVLDSGIPVRNL